MRKKYLLNTARIFSSKKALLHFYFIKGDNMKTPLLCLGLLHQFSEFGITGDEVKDVLNSLCGKSKLEELTYSEAAALEDLSKTRSAEFKSLIINSNGTTNRD